MLALVYTTGTHYNRETRRPTNHGGSAAELIFISRVRSLTSARSLTATPPDTSGLPIVGYQFEERLHVVTNLDHQRLTRGWNSTKLLKAQHLRNLYMQFSLEAHPS